MARRRPRKRPPAVLPFDYVGRTRALPVNLVFLMPLVLIYSGALLATRSPVENAAGGWMRAAVLGLGDEAAVLAALFVALGLTVLLLVRRREAPRERGIYGGMCLEGVCYGSLLGLGARALAESLPMGRMIPLSALSPGAAIGLDGLSFDVRMLGLAAGAGVFEELLFRGGVLAGILLVLKDGLGMDRITAACLALVASSWVFSDYHHWGAGGEPYDAAVFAFRFHAGLLLGAIFLSRGIGIAALAHGFYDALVML
jgi:membrane protease YdiL (CAAX protease family)